MRLKHRPWGDEFLLSHQDLIKNKDTLTDEDIEKIFSHSRVELEIGVGRGNFILNMAKNNSDCYFIGVELSGMALAIAGKKIINEEMNNLILINMDVHYLFSKIKDKAIDTIYLNFSDPWPKKRQHKRRLTYPTCLKEYYRVLKDNGKIIFKTDNDGLFEDSIEYFSESEFNIVSITHDYAILDNDDAMTEYEEKFRGLGTKIKRLIANKES